MKQKKIRNRSKIIFKKKKGGGGKTGYDVVEWEELKSIKQGTERVNIRQSISE